MEYELNARFASIKWRIILSLFALLSVVTTCLVPLIGILSIPALIAVLTLLLVAERGRFPIFSLTISVVSILTEFVLYGFTSLISLASVVIAVLIYFAICGKGFSKGETALLATVLLSVAFAVMLIFSVFAEIGSYNFNDALGYIGTLFEEAKITFITSYEEAIAEYESSGLGLGSDMSNVITPELMSEMFDAYANLTISLIALFAFFLVGCAFKLVVACLGAFFTNRQPLSKWRFELSAIFAYFYIAIYFASMFLGIDNVIGIAILNLTSIFTFVFAYLGFVSLARLLSVKFRNKFLAYLLLFGATITLYSLAINLLAVIGVFSMIALNRTRKLSGGNGDKLQ